MRLISCLVLFVSMMVVPPVMADEGSSVSVDKPPTDTVPAQSVAEAGKPPECPLPVKKAESEFVHELDPYYSEVSLHIPLTDEPIPETSDTNEFRVYRKLFVDSLIPKYMLVEAAVMPLPLTGVALKKYTPEFYRAFNVGSGKLNLMQAITAGFQEPYAFSLFFGDMVSFVRPGEDKICTNKGYMGYLVSYSNQHIKRNVLIPDHNIESEWKMKGERSFNDDRLSWSFRIGAKFHENPDITNTVYLGFRRNNLDFKADFLSIFENSDIDIRWDFSSKDGSLLRQQYIIGKKYPLKKWHVAFRMDVGLIWEDPAVYMGQLHDKDFQNLTAVLRPNIEF